jgi:hypothetical protein
MVKKSFDAILALLSSKDLTRKTGIIATKQ